MNLNRGKGEPRKGSRGHRSYRRRIWFNERQTKRTRGASFSQRYQNWQAEVDLRQGRL